LLERGAFSPWGNAEIEAGQPEEGMTANAPVDWGERSTVSQKTATAFFEIENSAFVHPERLDFESDWTNG